MARDSPYYRQVHEGGYGVRFEVGEGAVFSLSDGRIIPQAPEKRSRGNVFAILSGNQKKGLGITAETSVPRWGGERMDYVTAVYVLLGCQ